MLRQKCFFKFDYFWSNTFIWEIPSEYQERFCSRCCTLLIPGFTGQTSCKSKKKKRHGLTAQRKDKDSKKGVNSVVIFVFIVFFFLLLDNKLLFCSKHSKCHHVKAETRILKANFNLICTGLLSKRVPWFEVTNLVCFLNLETLTFNFRKVFVFLLARDWNFPANFL